MQINRTLAIGYLKKELHRLQPFTNESTMGEEKNMYHLTQILPSVAHQALYTDEPYTYNWVAMDDEDMIGQVDRLFMFELGWRLADKHETSKRMCGSCNACAICKTFARVTSGDKQFAFRTVVPHATPDIMDEAARAVGFVLKDAKERVETLRTLTWSEQLISFVEPHIQPFVAVTAFRAAAVLKLIEKTRDACQIVASTA